MTSAPKILVVDDDSEARELLARIFEVDEYTVLHARDGKAALDMLRTEHPDVVLLDLGLPVVDGRELLKRLRADIELTKTCVVVVSGAADVAELDADAYVTKPLSIRELRRVLSIVHERAPLSARA